MIGTEPTVCRVMERFFGGAKVRLSQSFDSAHSPCSVGRGRADWACFRSTAALNLPHGFYLQWENSCLLRSSTLPGVTVASVSVYLLSSPPFGAYVDLRWGLGRKPCSLRDKDSLEAAKSRGWVWKLKESPTCWGQGRLPRRHEMK